MRDARLEFRCCYEYRSGFRLDAEFTLEGGICALFGPSGSGKSTCLSLIVGLLKPQAGAIRMGDTVLVDCAGGHCIPSHRRRIGMVFQDHLLFPHRSVAANLRYGMARSGEGTIRFDEVVDVLELGDLLDRYPAQLSGGQQRRVALGRALLTQPRLLLMDEPLNGLEEALRDRILEHLQRVHEHWQMPMLLVSHDQVAVRRLAEHVVVLERGSVVDQGPVNQTLDRATLQTLSTHTGPTNLLRIEQVHQVGDHSAGRIGDQPFYLRGRVPSSTVYVRCAPSDVALVLEDVPVISMRNHLRGSVCDIVCVSSESAGEVVYVAIDVGQVLWAQVTPSACREMGLQKGTRVVCLIKASAMDLVT